MNGTNGHHANQETRRPIRIGGCSGSVTDRRQALAEMAASDAVDVIAGDWMSEVRMRLSIMGLSMSANEEVPVFVV